MEQSNEEMMSNSPVRSPIEAEDENQTEDYHKKRRGSSQSDGSGSSPREEYHEKRRGSNQSDDSGSSPREEYERKRRRSFDTPYPRARSPRSPDQHSQHEHSQEATNHANPLDQEQERHAQHQEGEYEDDDADFDKDYDMSDDQRQAMKELHDMKLDIGYTGICQPGQRCMYKV